MRTTLDIVLSQRQSRRLAARLGLSLDRAPTVRRWTRLAGIVLMVLVVVALIVRVFFHLLGE